ncbi:MAG: RecQ family ATP-dependent DNA helicase [Sphingobacteriales bacterium]|nr:RecQ family ATP-dependent DNA helicase [Sphingobacteriales bacterium]
MSIQEVLKTYWGYDTFRNPQEAIIESVLAGHDTLALLPTGAGKSICYQVPIMAQEGIGIVISPLIALMKDQVQQLKRRGIPAIEIVSGMSAREIDIALDNCIYGNVKFLYLSPERLQNELVQERIKRMKVNLLAVDEAHCISQWGYDFRPAYLLINEIKNILPHVPILALTATATSKVVIDIQEKLQFKKPNVFQISFERSNLNYLVLKEENKYQRLLRILAKVPGSAICYVRNRKHTEEYAKFLQSQGISADFYHAGLDMKVRSKKQDEWILNKTNVIIATNAFGMGIDKPDVRVVVHLDLPDSLEAYYQEAGRAGRDGLKSYAVLLYQDADVLELQQKSKDSFPTFEEIEQGYHHLYNHYHIAFGAGKNVSVPFDWVLFSRQYQLPIPKLMQVISFLEKDGYINMSEPYKNDTRICFRVSPDQLYAFQIANSHFDLMIKTLLRSYGGMFENYVAIVESDLVKRTGLHLDEFNRQIKLLQSFNIIDYIAGTQQPLLTFLEDRLPKQQQRFDKVYWKQRKGILEEKVMGMSTYVTKNECRSKQLLAYFGELNYEDCGQCDVCLSRKNTDNEGEIKEKIFQRIILESSKEKLSLPGILQNWTDFPENLLKSGLQELIDEGRIQFNDNNGVIVKTEKY